MQPILPMINNDQRPITQQQSTSSQHENTSHRNTHSS